MKILLKLSVLALLLVNSLAFAQSSGRPSTNALPQAMLEELLQLVNRAESDRSADRRFLDDLRQFIDNHDRPWSRIVLRDQFADGNFTRSPTWRVVRGEFFVDRRYGLFSEAARRPSSSQQSNNSQSSNSQSSKRDSGADLAAALIGSLLQKQLGKNDSQSNQQQQKPAVAAPRIETAISSGNAFALEVDISNISEAASVLIGLHVDANNETGYQLVLTPGNRGAIELLRVTARGTAVVDSYRRNIAANQRGFHRLRWTRGRTGNMRVTHNGTDTIRTADRGLANAFKRLSIVNENGQLGVQRVELHSTP